MLRTIIIAIVALLTVGCAGRNSPLEHIQKQPFTKLVLNNLEYDFGEVWEGDVLECSFELSNQGNKPLKIFKQKASCGCTVIKPIKGVLLPGEKEILEAKFSTADFHGAIIKTIDIATNDHKHQNLTLKLIANVKKCYSVAPEAVNFGNIEIGKTVEKEVAVDRIKGQGLIKIKDVKCNSNALELADVTDTNEGLKLKLSYSPKCVGDFKDSIVIIPDNSGLPDLRITCYAKSYSQTVVNPDRVFFGCIKEDIEAVRQIKITMPEEQFFDELYFKDELPDGLFGEINRIDQEHKYQIALTWRPSDQKRKLNTQLILNGKKDNKIQTIIIPCFGLHVD